MSERLIRQRLLLFQIVVVLAFAILTAQLWRIQIIGGEDYQKLSEENGLRLATLDAPRGVVYDRYGRILVRNRPSFRATLVPAHVEDKPWLLWTEPEWEQVAATLGNIARGLQMPFPTRDPVAALQDGLRGATGQMLSEDINKLCQEGLLIECFGEALVTAPYREVTIKTSLSTEMAFSVMENSLEFPGVAIVSSSQRQYLYGPLYAHLLGYELPISQEQLNRQTRFTTNPYLSTDRIGTAGIEQGFENQLRGIKGTQVIEQNVFGEQIRVISEQPSTPGHNLFLTIDTELQIAVTQALQEGMASVNSQEGVAIVMNPNTGEILAMVSLPTYDNNLFVGDIDAEQFQQLSQDARKPMFNRAISGTYPPGSIFKIIPAAGALADGVIDRNTTIHDPGIIYLPNENVRDNPELAMRLAQPFVCWLETGHDEENVVDALAHSCDVFFYQVAGGYLEEFTGMGIDALSKWATAFGLGDLTRIRLPGEAMGRVPTRQWKRLNYQQSWVTGDTYNMSIGQGYVTVTPLQMLNATSAIANGGSIYEPQVVYQVQDANGQVAETFQPRLLRHVNVAPEHLAIVAEGMRGAISWEDGTARLPFEGVPVNVAGKTGTAEYCPVIKNEDGTFDCKMDANGNQLTHAWFTAFAPYENPEIALVVFIHGNEESVIQGSEIAAPVARRIIDFYFTREPLELLETTPVISTTLDLGTLATPQAAEPIPSDAGESLPVPSADSPYRGSLISTEPHDADSSVVSGRVVDRHGGPLAGVVLNLDNDGVTVEALTTAEDGSFRFDQLSANPSPSWTLRAPELPGEPLVQLQVASRQHYIVLFQEE